MNRERALKVVLVVVGLLFCAGVYPLILMAKQDPALAMMMSLYVTLGIFLLIASRNPSGPPQPDRVCGVVELCARRNNVFAGVAEHDLTQRTDRVCCVHCHRRNPDHTDPGRGDSGASSCG